MPPPASGSLLVDSLGLKILFVEDNDEIREALVSLLEGEGYEVGAVASAEEGLVRLESQSFDLLITDYSLPGETGTWLIQHAVQRHFLEASRVLLVTAHPKPQGAEGIKVIRKPLDLDDFLREIYDLLAPARAAALERTRRKLDEQLQGAKRPDGAPKAEFVLYISSASPSSLKALRNMQRLLGEYQASQVRFTVCDLLKEPGCFEEDHVAFTPTLVKRLPGPKTWIVGDLQDSSMVTDLLSYAGVEKRQ